jgi:hypothetical protein
MQGVIVALASRMSAFIPAGLGLTGIGGQRFPPVFRDNTSKVKSRT